ncbi:hypothetical protein KSP39_PZI014582 [Platanthera zijinensis]|uniref:Uncharacterized protein n=1 Tax=Platanthera zijinensis TaxID=2320716 RepID=A0AAP0B9K3_9ASPA
MEENAVYRFCSVGQVSFGLQDAQILIWNLQIDENFELVQYRDESTSRDATASLPGALRPSPRLQQLPKLSFVGGNCVHMQTFPYTRSNIKLANVYELNIMESENTELYIEQVRVHMEGHVYNVCYADINVKFHTFIQRIFKIHNSHLVVGKWLIAIEELRGPL